MRYGVITIVAILIITAGIGFASGSELVFKDDFESYTVDSYPSSPWYSIWSRNAAYMPDLYTVNTISVGEVVSNPEGSMNKGDTASLEGSGSSLVKSSDTTLLWENETADYVLSVSVSESGEYVAIGSRDTYVYYFNKSGSLIWKHKTNGAVNSVSISDNGNYIIAGSEDHHIYYFDINGLLWEIEVDVSITAVDISSDGRYAIAGSWNKYIYFFDSHDSNKPLWQRLLDVYVSDVSISDNGEYVAIGGGCVYLLDKYNTTIWEKDIGGVVDISGDGNYTIVGGGLNGRNTYCYDKSGELEWDDPYDEYLDDNHGGSHVSISSVSLSADGSYGAVGSYGWDITIRSFDKTGNVVWRIKNDTYAVDISGDSHYIAAGASSSEIGERILYIDNFDNGNIIYDYSLEDPVWEIDLSKDGKYLAAAAKNTVYFFGSPGGNPEPNITAQIYSDGLKPVESFSVHPLETRDIKFTIENRGWGSNLGYIDISVSNGLDIISWEDDSSGYMNYENLGPNSNNPTGEATYSDGSRRVPQFELLSGYKPFGSGEKNTVTVTVKATGEDEQWIKYRASMESSDGYVRDPSSGDVDQQGWHAYNIAVTVEGIQPDIVIPIEDEYADWISIGDLNDDRLNDIVMENGDILYQQLDNSFLTDNLGFDGICVCTGKINNDDLTDIVMTSHFSEPPTNYGLIHIYYQQNDNTFDDVPDLAIETGYWAKYCQIDDINNDGLNDILVGFGIIGSTGETSTKIYYQKEDGSFGSTPDVDAEWLSGIVSLSDFNQDGLKDLVGETASTWGLVVYYQSPDHTFDSTYDERMTHLPFGVDTLFKGMGDVDGNGLDDSIYNNNRYPDQSVVYSQWSDHSFIVSDISYVTGRDVNSIDIGDLNDDGQNDVVVFYDDHTFKGPGFIGIYYQKYVMDVEILSPTNDFSVLKNSDVPMEVKVTYEGEPITGASLVRASLSNGDSDVILTGGVNGIYAGTWTPTNTIEGQVETPVEIMIEASHGTLRKGYAKVDGVIRTEIPLNIDIISPEVRFTVNKTIPQLIRIKVTDGSGSIIPGSTITKSEVSFSNGDSTIQLCDDGEHHDGSADDGIYANVWIPENIDSGSNIDVSIEANIYSGDHVLASKAVEGILTPNEYVLLDTVVAYEDDISKNSVISIYYNVSKEDPELYNLFLEINRKIPEDIGYDPFAYCPQCYPANSFGTISLSIPENVDFVNSLRGTYGLNWTKYREKVPNSDEWPRGSVIPQYFFYGEHYEDMTMGIKKPAEREKTTCDILSVLGSIIDKIPGYNVPKIFDIFLAGGSYVLETSEDIVFDADLIIGAKTVHQEFSELNTRDTIVLNWIDGGDYWKNYESVVTTAPLKFQDVGTHEIVVQQFFDLKGKDVLYNKKISMNIFGVDDENIHLGEPSWDDLKLEKEFEVVDSKIIYNSSIDNKPMLSTAISVSRKVNKTDPNKQVLYFEVSRKTDPENDHKLVEGGWYLWPNWPEWLIWLFSYYAKPVVPVYITQSAAYGGIHHNLEDVVFQISFDEDVDIIHSRIKDYEISQRNFIIHNSYELWPDGDQLTDDKESFIPQYFEYTDKLLYPETEEGRHYNFYKEVPLNNWDKQMAVLTLYLSFVPGVNWLTTLDTILDLWTAEYGMEFIENQKPYEEILDTNERDLIIRDFFHVRPNDRYESVVSEIPINLNNAPTDVYFTILFNVGGKGKSGKTAAYSKKITLDREFNPTQLSFESKTTMILECPANLHAYDDEGNHVGLNPDGTVDLDIPHSYYKGANSGRETITLFGNSSFLFEVQGYGDGEFNLTLLSQSADNGLVSRKYTKIPLLQKTIAKITTDETINPTYLIQVDRDGDGEVDYPQLPNSTEQIILSSTIYVPIDNQTIQEAINIARENDTIYVLEGVYNESITVDKSLFIIGEDKSTTIIDGGGSDECVHIIADNVTISGFTTRNDIDGVYLDSSDGCNIEGNIILNNDDGISLYNSNNNRIYHNNFIDNDNHAYDDTDTNQWDNGYPSGGNYWSEYTGDDYYSGPNQEIPGSDGIIDAPYDINGDSGVQDNYPFTNKDGWSIKDLTVTILHPNGGESIPIGTAVQVSAHATDDTAVTSVTFSYSINGGSTWNSIGAGTIVSGTSEDGIWNRTWNTNWLDAGSNYLIKAVACDGTLIDYDRSDSTFSLITCTPPSTPTLNDPGTTDTDGSYTVAWSSVSGATSYTLEEDTSGLFGSPSVVYSGSGKSKQITGRRDGTYYYRVKACNACGCSGWSGVEDIGVSISHEEEGWDRTFGGADGDVAYSVQQTSDGGFILAGYTDSYGAGGSDFWLVKTDSNGNEQWNMTFGETDYDIARSVQETSDDGYIIAGWYFSTAGKCDARLVRTDSGGGILWHLTFGGAGWDVVESVQQTSDGSFIITGYTDSYGAGHYDAWLVKIDPYGCIQWNKTFGGFGRDVAESVRQTSDGGYIIAGSTQPLGGYLLSTGFMNPLGVDFADVWLVKTDSNGNKQWDQTFGGNDWDTAESVQQTSDGGFILAGYTKSYGAGGPDFWLIKTYSNGNKQWDKTFGETDDDYAYSVQQTSDGGYILVGVTEPHSDPPASIATSMSPCGAGGSDVWLVKTDSEGGKEWDKTFGGTDDDCASSVQQTSDGGYILAGYTKSYGAGGSDFWLIKLGTAAHKRGDLNSDNRITPADAAIAIELAATGGWDPAADVDGDSRITSLDALMILQAAAGAITL